MAETTKQLYLDLQGLQQYDALIKAHISTEDAKSIKSAVVVNDVIRLYKVETPADNDPYIALDLSDYLHKIKNAKAGNVVTVNADGTVVDGGTALSALALKTEVGSLETLKTKEKTSAVVAINELKDTLDQADKDHKVSLSIETTPTEGMLKTYTIKQGEGENQVVVGKIDIPKDLVVTEGSIVENPDAEHVGTFIKLVIANQEAPLYINVKDLIDIYTAQQNATQVQLAVSSTNELSATIVEKSINTKELADAAVTTEKIADSNVTEAKLGTDSVTTTKIKDENVTAAKLATDSVETVKIKDANVTTAKLADNAVETAKIKDLNVTTAKLADLNVTTGKIADAAVETAKIKDANVTAAKLATDSVETAKIKDKAITEAKLDEALQDWIGDVSGLLGLSESEEGEEVVTVAQQITNAVNSLDSVATSADVEAGKGLKITVTQTDGKLVQGTAEAPAYGVVITGDYSNTYDAKGAAAQALKDAKNSFGSIEAASINALFNVTEEPEVPVE